MAALWASDAKDADGVLSLPLGESPTILFMEGERERVARFCIESAADVEVTRS